MLDFHTQTALITALINFVLTFLIFLTNPGRAINRSFSFLSFCLFCWNASAFFMVVNPHWFWVMVLYITFAFLPIAALHFVLNFIGRYQTRSWTVLRYSYLFAGVFTIAVTQISLVGAIWPKIVLAVYVMPLGYLELFQLIRRYFRTLSRLERTQLVYIVFGSIALIALGFLDFLASFGLNVPELGSVGAFIFTMTAILAIIRYRLLDVSAFFGRALLILLLTTFLWILYSFLGFIGLTSATMFFNVLLATLFVLTVYEPLRRVVDALADRILQKESYEFQSLITAFSKEVVAIIDLDELFHRTHTTLLKSQKVGVCSIYLADEEGKEFVLKEPRDGVPLKKRRIESDKAFIQYLQQSPRVLLREDLERDLNLWYSADRKKRLRAVIRSLSWLDVDLCVPFHYHGRLMGFLNLKGGTQKVVFTRRERDLLATLAAQLAISISNAQMYRVMKQNDRLIALGEMATGLAHEIRNPLGAIKAAAQYLTPDLVDEGAKEVVAIIQEEVDRLNNVLTQFLDYTRPTKKTLGRHSLNTIVERTLALLKKEPRPTPVEVRQELDPEMPATSMDGEQIKQVLVNLVLNAFQALEQGGTLTVRTGVIRVEAPPRPEEKERSLAEVPPPLPQELFVSVEDTGGGIAAADLQRLFIPFYTTREHGSGLGLAIAQRIVENHAGRITAQSTQGKGSVFTVFLPFIPAEPPETPDEP